LISSNRNLGHEVAVFVSVGTGWTHHGTGSEVVHLPVCFRAIGTKES
jgi:hypothetical protein